MPPPRKLTLENAPTSRPHPTAPGVYVLELFGAWHGGGQPFGCYPRDGRCRFYKAGFYVMNNEVMAGPFETRKLAEEGVEILWG